MPRLILPRALALAAFMSSAAPAFAELTAQEVWGGLRDNLAGENTTLGATEEQQGDLLTVRDIEIIMPVAPDNLNAKAKAESIYITLPELRFRERDNGTVSVEIPQETFYEMSSDALGRDTPFLTMQQSALTLVVGGQADAQDYTFSADAITMQLVAADVSDDADDGPVSVEASVTFDGAAGNYLLGFADPREISGNFTARVVEYVAKVAGEDGGQLDVTGSYKNFSTTPNYVLPGALFDEVEPSVELLAQIAVDMGFTHAGGELSMQGQDDDGRSFSWQMSSGAGAAELRFDTAGARYRFEGETLAAQFSAADLPFPPMDISLDGYEILFEGPFSKTGAPQPFAGKINLSNFVMSDFLWAMFDPAAQLPRDPLLVNIDLTGSMDYLTGLFEAAQAQTEPVPQLYDLSINDITLRAAGAELTGKGAFSFDNNDLASFGGVPRPEGALDLKLTGGNGLLDKLIAMGLVPQDQALGLRMMIGAFAQATGDDTLESKIEIDPQGAVFANGQRLR